MNAVAFLRKIESAGGWFSIDCNALDINIPEELADELDYKELRVSKDKLIKLLKLRGVIKQVSEKFGGDTPEFLADYIQSVMNNWEHDLNTAIACFTNILNQFESSP